MRPTIVLYNPHAVFYTMPLGLIAVGSALDPAEYNVVLVDGRLEPDPLAAIHSAIAQSRHTLCVGMGVLTGAPIRDALAVSRALKKRYPDLPIIWGGWHPSLFPEQCLQEPAVDAVVLGQGELTFCEIVARLQDTPDLDGIAGCVHRTAPAHSQTQSQTNIRVEPPRPLAEVNTFPAHNYNLISVPQFFARKGKRQFDYISSQGCRFRCAFCADPFVYKRGWTGLSPERIVTELWTWWQQYHFEEVSFQDETFFTSQRRVADFAEALLSAELPVSWTATLRADQGDRLDNAVWAAAKRSGLSRVMIGIESGSQAMLDWMQKDMSLEQAFISAEQCLRHGVGAIFNIIVGFPGESEDSVHASLAVARRLRAMSPAFQVAIFYYRPYPGNPIADQLLHDGYRFPDTLDGWADFDYVDSGSGAWMAAKQFRLVERFKFYQKHAYGPQPSPFRWPLRALSRLRMHQEWYHFPVEKAVVDYLRPPQALS